MQESASALLYVEQMNVRLFMVSYSAVLSANSPPCIVVCLSSTCYKPNLIISMG